jgi:hypothetical protein
MYRLRLNAIALEGGPPVVRATVQALARRIGAEAMASEPEALAGDHAEDVLRKQMRACSDPFGDDLRALHILMRIAFLEVKEQLNPGAKGDSARKGAQTVAIRGAVGHPQ